jgi:serine/threonine protein kinase
MQPVDRSASSAKSGKPAAGADGKSATPVNIGRYKVIGRLGKGGMAEVLLALQHDESSDFKRLVVIKRVIPALEDEEPLFIQMFLDEARLAARLSHANVVQTYEVGDEAGSPFLAMEFLDGQSLNSLQRRAHALGQKVPLEVALRIFCDALEGLHYAHELRDFDGKPLKVIHRDVTPSNIFIKYDGTTKLVDFGIAKSATQREKTRAGMLKGKMAYMAPEQLRDEAITRAVDVWAMGIVMWETLAGERLFRGKNDFETVQAIMRAEIPKLSAKRPDVPPALDAVLLASMDRDPEKRIQSAEDMKSRLEDVAIQIGKPLRRGDVSKLMHELFSEAIEHNGKLVRDFLDRANLAALAASELNGAAAAAAGGGPPGRPAGALEFKTDLRNDMSTSRADATPVGHRSNASLPDFRTNVGDGGEGSSSRLDDRTTVDQRPSEMIAEEAFRRDALAQDQNAGGQLDGAGDDEARPLWHWIALGAALVSGGALAWYIIST